MSLESAIWKEIEAAMREELRERNSLSVDNEVHRVITSLYGRMRGWPRESPFWPIRETNLTAVEKNEATPA